MTRSSSLINLGTKGISLALGLLFLVSVVQQAKADDPYFAAGVQLYMKKDFKKAYSYFVAAGKNNPYDADVMYYEAMTLQQLGNSKAAVKIYASLVSNFSYSSAGKLAANALSRLDPEYYRQLTKTTSSAVSKSTALSIPGARSRATIGGASAEGLSPDFSSLPAEARIPYTKST